MSYPGSDSWMRRFWGQPCKPPLVRIKFCGREFVIHKRVRRLVKRFRRVMNHREPRYAKKIASTPDTASYNCRVITGGSRMSLHSWATPLDIRWQQNGYGKSPGSSEIWQEAKSVVNQMRQEGWFWGGDFSSTSDPMHFEPHVTPRQIRNRYHWNGKPKKWFRKKLRQGYDFYRVKGYRKAVA